MLAFLLSAVGMNPDLREGDSPLVLPGCIPSSEIERLLWITIHPRK